MEPKSRFLGLLVALPAMLAAAYVAAVALGIGQASAEDQVIFSLTGSKVRVTAALIAMLYLVLCGYWLFLTRLRFPRDRVILLASPVGKTVITRAALEALVRASIQGIIGVRKLRVTVLQEKLGWTVALQVATDRGAAIPAMGERMQSAVRTGLEQATGWPVHDVQVTIERIQPNHS
ncbi:alkaline shock response membrane anchor protein AmaP [Heliophilum fasciatum]|uniref:Alkaline shock family protein YloU n=1 Tax=Heliophilum fasciatum TaxID=35700 RepID=A0A4R2RSF9_9FIRM|nr:alkaline shock response membrane anchor protein AmaP [Heliophilum fasciatum]MCW2277333.1 hypothetical protein [Heliophilum fasciatum]TCP67170.1 hypothetical protein EDD73_10565 [Heliophilum fasciatum]